MQYESRLMFLPVRLDFLENFLSKEKHFVRETFLITILTLDLFMKFF